MLTDQTLLENLNFLLGTHCNGADLESVLRSAIWHNTVPQPETQTEPRIIEPTSVCTQWAGMDSAELYDQHCADPVARQQLIENHWLGTDIDYHINSWGFRSVGEYDSVSEPCIVALGCSFTFGTGLHQYQTWPDLLGQQLGIRVLNLGTPGHSLDLNSLWLTLMGHGITNPLAVCVLEPPGGRFSWVVQQMGDPAAYSQQIKNLCETVPVIVHNVQLNSLIHTYKNYHTVKSWAEGRGIPLLWNRNLLNPYRSMARDLAHFGTEWQQNKATEFYQHLKNLKNT